MAPVPQDAHAFGAPVAGTGAPVPRVADSPGVVNARKVGHIRPRLGGLVLLVVALLLVGINVWTLYEEKKFYPKALLFAPMAACTGTWLLIVGQPVDERTGEVLLWSRLGTGASAALGLLLGAFATWFVGC
jgi:hypothetical protein